MKRFGAFWEIVSHGRDHAERIRGNQPTVLAALADRVVREGLGESQAETREKAGVIEGRRIWTDDLLVRLVRTCSG